ncbi:biopolymer transporter ExbD [Prevotella sp. Rep29]|uniref:ExbD/TolR family protein n=1 Tax=Prevotella sp. Rep29 TaxID=2691580 RepID=UPI001C6E6261|nr:biopolymer transporter ExbD [Prevotella sp. Rep29]MBR1656497.1 biopolymer transporter ExbD [Prevotella sp.]QYR09916.1 biopolymer transporter ExbD [Prevotella sp. Rep29]
MAKQKESRQKKQTVRVDFTPMVDMMMLLITFFMLCTSLSKPQAMQLTMPSNDENIQDKDRNATKESHTITIYLAGNDKIYYIKGIPKYDDPSCMVETTWGKEGIRKVLTEHQTEEGIIPVARIRKAKLDLDAKKDETNMEDSVYQNELKKIRDGEINGEKIPTLTIIIKPLDTASYDNMVTALDEMQICSISKYVLDKISSDDERLLKSKNIPLQ